MHDAFTLNGVEVWTAEDGGRIRHGTLPPLGGQGVWSFQDVADTIEETVRRVQFLPGGLVGWAVTTDGFVLNTQTGGVGGSGWTAIWRAPAAVGDDPYESLWDVHFLNVAQGWVLGGRGMWYFEGGNPWTPVTLLDKTGIPIDPNGIELYSFDVLETAGGGLLGLVSGEPGLILRLETPTQWKVVYDMYDGLCNTGQLPQCVNTAICGTGVRAEPWDIEISRNAQSPLVLCVGGASSNCGFVLASTDGGNTWSFEKHECLCNPNPGCTDCSDISSNPNQLLYNSPGVNGLWHLKKYRELYGVAIFHGDNSAIASGYSGQVIVRDPTVTPAVWRDRTAYADANFDNQYAVTFAGYGVDAEKSLAANATNGRAVLTSTGGWIRTTADGGQIWTIQQPPIGRPWRIQDVEFTDANHGWLVSQFSLIARTDDAGLSWSVDNAASLLHTNPQLQALSIDGSGNVGVAVGWDPASSKGPRILVNAFLTSSLTWDPPADVIYAQGYDPEAALEDMREVTWAGGQEFWTVGSNGLVFHSDATLGPSQSWIQFLPPGEDHEQFRSFSIEGVSFSGTNDGVFVGQRTVGTQALGEAYHYHRSGSTVTWMKIELSAEEDKLEILSDVAFTGTAVYAVGQRNFGSAQEGVVLKSVVAGGSAAPFTVVQTIPECTVGLGIEVVPVLSEIEIDPGGTIWLGGQCGRLWSSTNGTGWTRLLQSQTDAHVQGMSFPAANTGFVAAWRPTGTQQCVVRITPNGL